jgi:predicted O-methyltransferase YrrM
MRLLQSKRSSNAISLGESMLSVGEESILPKLKERYNVVFLDGDWREYPRYLPHLRRLTHPGSIIVTANLNPLFDGWGGRLPGKPAIQSYLTRLVRDPHFRTYVVPGEWHSISVRV